MSITRTKTLSTKRTLIVALYMYINCKHLDTSYKKDYYSIFITCTRLFKIKLVVTSSNPIINELIPPTNITE